MRFIGAEQNPLGGKNIMVMASSDDDLIDWAKSTFGSVARYDYQDNRRNILVLVVDRGSGLTLQSVLIYEQNDYDWNLVLVRFTNSSELNPALINNSKELEFKSKSGKSLMRFTLDSLSVTYDSKEQ